MHISNEKNHSISGVFVFLLLGIFALTSCLLVLFSAQIYRSTVEKTEQHSQERLLESYIRNALRTADETDSILLENDPDIGQILCLHSSTAEDCVSYIYCYDNNLMTVLLDAEDEFSPEEGEILCPALSLSGVQKQGLLSLSLMDPAGKEHIVDVALRGCLP